MTKIYQLDDAEFMHQANKVMGVVVEGLKKEGFLTKEQADDIHTNYSVITEGRSWVPEFLCDWLGISENGLKIRMVKAIGREKSK